MGANLLTAGSSICCPHGGQAQPLLTTNTRVQGPDGAVLVQSDVHPVVGCPFTIGANYSPCVRIQWQTASVQTTVGGVAPLLATSVGLCVSAAGAPQGTAVIAATQIKAAAS